MNKMTLKINKYQIQFLNCALLFLWLMVLSACEVQNETSPTSIPPTPAQGTETVQAGVSSTPTATEQFATSIPTATATPSATRTASQTPTEVVTLDTPTATPTETMTPLPTLTLTAEELRQKWLLIDAQVKAIMASNNGCQLPCWWGIEPGDSVTDAQQIFKTINENGWITAFSPVQQGELQDVGYFRHVYRDEMSKDMYLGFTIGLLVQEDLIKVFDIFVDRNVIFDVGTAEYTQIGERILRDWEQYSAQNIFETFGQPELINLMPQSFADGNNFSYLFNLYYPSLGIVVSYSSPLLVGNNGERAMCLNMFDMDSVDLILYDPAVELPPGYVQATYRLWPLSSETEYIQLVEGSDLVSHTGMNIEKFVAFVLEDGSDSDCFTVNWPYGG